VDLFSDSMGVVAVAANPVLTAATKHLEIADFYVRELVQRGIVTVSYIRTVFMLADVLTKPLGPGKFFNFIGIIMGLIREDGTVVGEGVTQDGPDKPSILPS
jgi:hypothetical protein